MDGNLLKKASARRSIEKARRSVAESAFLDDSFKATAERTFAYILSSLNDDTLSVDDALSLTQSLMDAVIIQTQHAAFEANGRMVANLTHA